MSVPSVIAVVATSLILLAYFGSREVVIFLIPVAVALVIHCARREAYRISRAIQIVRLEIARVPAALNLMRREVALLPERAVKIGAMLLAPSARSQYSSEWPDHVRA